MREGEQRALLLAEAVTPVVHALTADSQRCGPCRLPPPMLRALATRARSVISAPVSSRLIGAVIQDEHAVAAADQLVIVGRVEEDRRARVGQLAQSW